VNLPAPWLSGRDGEVRLRVRVQPGAKRSGVLGPHGDRLKLAVQAPPVDGKANEAVCGLVADLLQLPARAVVVESGATGRDKTLRIDVSWASAWTALAG
jgi:uncharacterized protein (TIGR00251 family)